MQRIVLSKEGQALRAKAKHMPMALVCKAGFASLDEIAKLEKQVDALTDRLAQQ